MYERTLALGFYVTGELRHRARKGVLPYVGTLLLLARVHCCLPVCTVRCRRTL